MNETIELLLKSKSIRAYKDKEVSEEDEKLILESAFSAPTPGNQQLYSIIKVTDEKLKDFLSKSCDNQPFIKKGKLIYIFCADFQKWYDAFIEAGCGPRKPGMGDMMLSVIDATISCQNAVIAANSLGIGSCYIGDILENCEDIRKELELPDYVIPVNMLVLGYPTEGQILRNKPKRHEMNDILMENHYKRKDGDSLRKMFAKGDATFNYDEWMDAFCKRKYNSAFSIEMTRSVEKYLEKYKK